MPLPGPISEEVVNQSPYYQNIQDVTDLHPFKKRNEKEEYFPISEDYNQFQSERKYNKYEPIKVSLPGHIADAAAINQSPNYPVVQGMINANHYKNDYEEVEKPHVSNVQSIFSQSDYSFDKKAIHCILNLNHFAVLHLQLHHLN
ncbi:hypothetical protein CEXT_265241 [Caerostris extrusa]|uniref:Uncharacterized protein n=1 Tax=Caerostris extrusa TaxID=172846 RepID=A0AAV4UUC9_CAEEX|nr:hypothetical protein CEXT_265241 [Caerostris extrusa]